MIEIRRAATQDELEAIRVLLRQYGAIPGVSECVVGFAAEIEGLPGRYAEPEGTLLLASVDGHSAGCGALRKIGPGSCEMKRLYVEPFTRGNGLGRAIAAALIEAGCGRGYQTMRLDTLPSMESAIALYRSLGFRQIKRYDDGSPANVLYFELAL